MALVSAEKSHAITLALIVSLVPLHLHEGLKAYICHGRPTGDFLRAVLCNDLVDAVRRGDFRSRSGLVAIVMFLMHDVEDVPCWGSAAAYDAWTAEGRRVLTEARVRDTRQSEETDHA